MSFSSGRNISNNVSTDEAQTLTNKTIDSANNSLVVDADTATVSNIEADNLKAGVIDDDLTTTSVNDDTVPSAKAAKAYTDAAASTASSNLTTHETSTTGVHGVTGDIVGTSDTQTLTNKTITGADIRTPARADVKQDTRANLEVYATTATDGQIVYATDEKKYFGTKDNALVSLGGGLGSPQTVSVISADDLQAASDFSAQNTDIVTGGVATNGTLNGALSLSTTASELLTGVDKVIKYVAGASSQFDYFGHTHAIPQGFAGRTLALELTYRTAAGYTNGDFSVEILSDNGTTVSYLSNKIKLLDAKESADGNGETVRFLVNVPSDCETLKVAFQNLSATSGITFFVDKISVDIDDFNYKTLMDEKYLDVYWSSTQSIPHDTLTKVTFTGSTNNGDLTGNWSSGTFTAPVDALYKVSVSSGFNVPTQLRMCSVYIYKNGSLYTGNENVHAATYSFHPGYSNASMEIPLVATDTIEVYVEQNMGDGTANNLTSARLTISYNAQSKHVVVDSGDADKHRILYNGYISRSSYQVRFKTEAVNEVTTTGQDYLTVDNTTFTKITANKDCKVSVEVGLKLAGGQVDAQWRIYNSSGAIKESYDLRSVGSSEMGVSGTTAFLDAGDYIVVLSFNGLTDSASQVYLNVMAEAKKVGEYHLVPVTDQENVFSARFSGSAGASVSVISESSPFSSVSRTTTGVFVVNYSSLGLTTIPALTAIPEISNVAQFTAHVDAISATQATIRIGFDNGTELDTDFSIILQKQGADYKEPKAFIGNVVPTQTAYLDTDATHYQTAVSGTASYKTQDIVSASGDTNFVSVASNQFTLSKGKYHLEFGVGARNVGGWVDCVIYNITDATNQEEFLYVANSSTGSVHFNTVFATIEITTQKTFEIRTKSSASGFEYLSRIKITKVK